jgi:UDP-N-acetylglucosamine transferase subunit ALG13
VIFVTVGTHHQPFARLLAALGPLVALDELVVQHGAAPVPDGAAVAAPYLSFAQTVAYVERASTVVTHAGVGSFLVARRAGHVPVMVPRLHRLGEHVDDHQVSFARALDERGDAIAVLDVARLPDALRAVPPRRPEAAARPGPLHAAVRRALDGEPVGVPVPLRERYAARGRSAARSSRPRTVSAQVRAGESSSPRPTDETLSAKRLQWSR